MAFFKTAQEKEIEAQMERDEQLQAFDDRIQELKGKLTLHWRHRLKSTGTPIHTKLPAMQ